MLRENVNNRCVYTSPAGLCTGQAPLHPKEHALPAGLGNFENDLLLKNFICYECQQRFSRFEEVFLRNGTEAFFRRILGVKGRKRHKEKNIFVEPTMGISPLTVKGVHPSLGYEVLWEMTSQGEAVLLNQLVFKRADGTLVQVLLRPGSLELSLSSYGEEWHDWLLVACFSRPDYEDELTKILGSSLSSLRDFAHPDEQNMEVEGEMRALISLPYVQAIAKIAFHFVLASFHFSGFEEEFDDLKRFIYLGEGPQPARIAKEPLLPQLEPENARLRQWSHILTAELNPVSFIARLQFFAGPRLKPFTWHVNLGKNPSRLISEMALGLRYFYFEAPDASGFDGGIEKLGLGPKIAAS